MAMTDTTVDEPQVDDPAHAGGPPPPAAPVVPEVWPKGTDHKYIGSLFVIFSVVFLLVGVVLSLIMRSQLTTADATAVGEHTYRQLFTMHGTISVFLFLLPVWLGLGSAVVPLQIGASRMAFPRLHAMSLWVFLAGGAMVVGAPAASDVFSGWTLGDPIPEHLGLPGRGPDLLLLGLSLVCLAAVLVMVNLIVTILQLRAPGLTLSRLPMFSWSLLVSGAVLLLALPILIGAFGMLFVDRHYGASLFSGFTGSRGGNPLIWPRLFWFGAYPMLWALVIPALGVVSDIVATFAGRPLFSRPRAMAALGAVGVLSFAGWGTEIDTLVRAKALFVIGGLIVLAPAASLILNWLLTLRAAGKEAVDRDELRRGLAATPMLWAAGCLVVLALGLAGSAVSAVDAGGESHRNYWQVAQQHGLFFGAATIGAVAALSFWGPKLWGYRLSDSLGKLEILAVVGGTLLTVLGMFGLGIQDMAAHTASYTSSDNFGAANLIVTVGASIVGLGLLVLIVDLISTQIFGRGARAGADPWGGQSLEWATPSPPPLHNFDALPEIRSATPLRDLRIGVARRSGPASTSAPDPDAGSGPEDAD